MSILSKLSEKYNMKPIQISLGFSIENEKLILDLTL